MKSKVKSFLWLGGVFDQNSLNKFKSISAAANIWQAGLINELIHSGSLIYLLGYPSERVWPFGKLFVLSGDVDLKKNLNGRVVSYLNFPFIREFIQFFSLKIAAITWLKNLIQLPDYVIVFSTLGNRVKTMPTIEVAKSLKNTHGIPWVCIVADGPPPVGADRYVFLAWSTYVNFKEKDKAIHMDGGVASCDSWSVSTGSKSIKAFMYMGSLLIHGGAVELANAFTRIKNKDIELWMCGQGINHELIRLAKLDPRIKILGFLSEDELNKFASKAFAFVNPRLFSFKANKENFPSKILHYLNYSKPILSTITDGLHPDYELFLIPIKSELIEDIQQAIQRVLSLNEEEYDEVVNKTKSFCLSHGWDKQTKRFLNLLI